MKVKLVKGNMVKMIDGQARIDMCLADGWTYADAPKPIAVSLNTTEEQEATDEAPKRRGRPSRGE